MSSVCIFRHHVQIRIIILTILEFIIFMVSAYALAYVRLLGDGNSLSESVLLIEFNALMMAVIMTASMWAMGLYLPRQRQSLSDIMARIGTSFLAGFVVLTFLFYLFPSLLLGESAIPLALGFAFLGIAILRVLFYSSLGDIAFKRRIMVLGAGTRASHIERLRRRSDQRGFSNVGFLRCSDERNMVDSNKILEIDTPLREFAKRLGIDEIVVAVTDRRREFPLQGLLDCKMSGIRVIDICTFLERETGKIRLDMLRPSWIIYSDGFQQSIPRMLIKRVFNIALSFLILLLTLPILVITAVAILVEGKWKEPVLYRQTRVGENARPFQILKFRSMCVDAEKLGHPQWAQKGDPRITKVGRIIRKFRIDELPQLINVLRGDMSLVGPRPERLEIVNELNASVPYYAERHRVKPGITGWAQLWYPYGASEEDAIEKLQYDLYYVKNHSLFLDLTILVQTAEVVLFGKGAR